MIELVLDSLRQELERFVQLTPRLLAAALVVLITWLIGRVVARALQLVLKRGDFTPTHRSFFRNLIVWVFGFLGVVAALNVLGLRSISASLLAGGGATAVVLAFAFREIGENFLAGVFLAFSRPYSVGDLIQSHDLQGSVRSTHLRYTHIRTADGRDIFIPNAQIFKNPLINFTRDGLRRPSFKLGIDYRDDLGAAVDLIATTVRDTPGVLSDPAVVVTLSEFTGQYVEVEATFWIDSHNQTQQVRTVRSAAMEASRRALAEAGYTFSAEVTTGLVLEKTVPVEVSMGRSG